MTKDETRTFLRRIKQHYQEFTIDNYKLNEWYKELKDYSDEDINRKFEEHLKSEQYGSTIPKIWFLTKYLTKESEKEKETVNNIKTNCTLCGKELYLSEFEEHYHKCSSIDYVIRQYKKFTEKTLSREKLEQMNEETFDKIYNEVLAMTLEKGNEQEKIYCSKLLEI